MDFIEKAKLIHNKKYDYSLVEYKDTKTKVKIICPIHGEFYQTPAAHLRGQGCPTCAKELRIKKIVKKNFIEEAKRKFSKYDYSKVKYINNVKKVEIICPEHGSFFISPNVFLGTVYGCPKCAIETNSVKKRVSQEEFIKRAKLIHNNKYDYSLVEYRDSRLKVKIICPIHGIFEQKANNHLRGQGCPKCKDSKGEKKIREILKSNGIIFKEQKKFSDLKDKSYLSYDFYLPEYNLLIEYNGEQHYIKSSFKHHNLLLQKHHDWLKRNYARKHKIDLLVIPYWENIGEIIERKIKHKA